MSTRKGYFIDLKGVYWCLKCCLTIQNLGLHLEVCVPTPNPLETDWQLKCQKR